MPWMIAPTVQKPYRGVNWIHPLKQHSVEVLLEEIQKHPEIKYAIIFGSSVEERCTEFSDVDVLMLGARNIKFISPKIDEYDIIYAEGVSETSSLFDEVERDGVCIYDKTSNADGMV